MAVPHCISPGKRGSGLLGTVPQPTTKPWDSLWPFLLCCDFLGLHTLGTGCAIFRHHVTSSVISSDPALHASVSVVSSVVQGQAWGPQARAGAPPAPVGLPQRTEGNFSLSRFSV